MNMNKWTGLAVGLSLVFSSGAIIAKEHVIGQKDKAFSVSKMVIQAGDSIAFENNDPFFHNVFSISGNKVFDLGSYPAGESRTVVFDKPGTIEVECAIHSDMYLEIQVK